MIKSVTAVSVLFAISAPNSWAFELPLFSKLTKQAAPVAAAPLAAAPLYATTLNSETTFNSYAKSGGVLSNSGRSIKFLIDNRNPAARSISFINGNYQVNGRVPSYATYHYDFAVQRYQIGEDVATFNNTTYYAQNKRFFAGTIQTYLQGDSATPIYAVQFYPDDVISEATLLDALKTVKANFTIPNAKLAFVATGTQQTFNTIATQARALNIDLFTIDQVLGNIKYIGLNPGEAWGYLRLFPQDVNTLRPTDIPVFEELPLDLSVVSGVITKAYQDINSHVNLKSKERNTPNMVLRDANPLHPSLQPWANQPVHLVVTAQGYKIEATTPAIIEQKLAQKLNRPWTGLPVVNESRLQSFDELCNRSLTNAACFDSAKRYGGKTTGLGFLARAMGRTDTTGTVSTQYGYDLTPKGIGIPVQFYRDMMAMPENAALAAKVNALVSAEKVGNLSPAERNAMVAEVQGMFYKAKLPANLVADVKAKLLAATPGVAKFKFRSSATSEDVANFNGAGLYDSFSIEPEKADNADLSCTVEPDGDAIGGVVTKLKVKPKTVQCGIKAVYASLWNSRALVERSFARLDHATAGMGITINPSYGDEAANLVLVTRVLGSDVYGYSLSIQQGENLVTNPLPGTISEYTVAAFSDASRPTRFTTTRYAKPTVTDPVRTTTVLSQKQMSDIVDIAKKIEIAYCKAKPSYYPNRNCNYVWLDKDKPLSLDMEVKILPNGNYLFKQMREFHGR
ncbi:PEP/pyruvate-binding domain-containing protein [Parachitinimonas caeni]|uniref:PEP/pyruvate-binding domain-containing protein n=1 Tax=Parachitinimonas caeni TaxID=3031301 RepID=A0ABT7E3Q7_9NEIS|nr:PEP/pyruvate-binding domain-containing protein [Parachitinimonas caeni]MDK2126945.1 PEP/pyruvate-binding domain-containing protein [Parachitinimonas caeni]